MRGQKLLLGLLVELLAVIGAVRDDVLNGRVLLLNGRRRILPAVAVLLLLLLLRRGVPHALQDPHQEDVRGQLVDLRLYQDPALGAPQLLVLADDFLQALLAERVLAGEHLARRVQPLQAHGTLQQVVQRALVHRPRVIAENCFNWTSVISLAVTD